MIFCLLAVSWATPTRPLARVDEPLRAGRYATVEGDGPAFARWRRRTGAIAAWTFPDRQVERFVRFDGETPIGAAWFSPAGARLATATYVHGAVAAFDPEIPDLPPVDVSTWHPVTLHGLRIPAPGPPSDGTWRVGSGRIAVERADAADPTDPDFADVLADGCGCIPLDRHAAWIDGRRGVRFLLGLPDPDGPRRAEVWVVPTGGTNLVARGEWPEADPSAWATLRAMVSLATWEAP